MFYGGIYIADDATSGTPSRPHVAVVVIDGTPRLVSCGSLGPYTAYREIALINRNYLELLWLMNSPHPHVSGWRSLLH